MVTKFLKRPVVVEAMQFDGGSASLLECASFVGESALVDEDCGALYILTLEGVMKAKQGDWIIKGVEGEFYPCKPDIFEQTYEAVDD